MTSKELVEICKKRKSCKEYQYMALCTAYQFQFHRHPFDMISYYDYSPEANSDTEIQISDFVF